MVRCGLFDMNDPPTPHEPMLAACVACDNRDSQCRTCGGRGTFRVEADPRGSIPSVSFKVCQFADMYIEHGIPLVPGGIMDQSNWFNAAASFCASDRERNLAEHYGTA